MHMEISIEIWATAVIKDMLNEVSFYRCLLLVEEFIKVMNSLEMTLKEEKVFGCSFTAAFF